MFDVFFNMSLNASLKDFMLTLYPSLGKLNMIGSEYLHRLFCHCRFVHDLWRYLKDFQSAIVFNCIEELVLFGIQRNTITDQSFHLILLLQECLPVQNAFTNIVQFKYNIKRYYTCARRNQIKFNQQCCPYLILAN